MATADETSAPIIRPPAMGRLAALSGVALTVVSFAAFSVEGPDTSTATVDQVLRYYTENGTALRTYAMLLMASVALMVVFASQLRALVRQAGPSASALADITYAGGLLTAVWFWLDASLAGFIAVVDDISVVDPAVLRSWYSLGAIMEYFSDLGSVPRGLLITAMSVAALRFAVLPRWLGWVGLIIGIECLIDPFLVQLLDAAAPLFFLGLFGFFLWPLAVGAVLARRAFDRDARTVQAEPQR